MKRIGNFVPLASLAATLALVQMLLAQQCFEWGHRSVEHPINKLHLKKTPKDVKVISPLTSVTKENVEAFGKNWEKWLPK